MNKFFCKSDAQRESWAVSLCFASTILMSLEALHGNACQWMGLDADQSFALSALVATLSAFMGAFVMTRHLKKS